MNEKIYCGAAKEIDGKYGKQLKLAFGPKDLEALAAHRNERGWVNVWLHRRKEVGKNGETHYGVIDTWQPNAQSGPGAKLPERASAAAATSTPPADDAALF